MQKLFDFSPEERAANLAKAQAASAAAKQWAEENLRQDFADENHWRDLASRAGVRMPPRHIPGSSVKHLKRVLKKLGAEPGDYCLACGVTALRQLGEMNRDWPAWAQIGLILEHHQTA